MKKLGVYRSVSVLKNPTLPHDAIAFSLKETHSSSRVLNKHVCVISEGTKVFLCTIWQSTQLLSTWSCLLSSLSFVMVNTCPPSPLLRPGLALLGLVWVGHFLARPSMGVVHSGRSGTSADFLPRPCVLQGAPELHIFPRPCQASPGFLIISTSSSCLCSMYSSLLVASFESQCRVLSHLD